MKPLPGKKECEDLLKKAMLSGQETAGRPKSLEENKKSFGKVKNFRAVFLKD